MENKKNQGLFFGVVGVVTLIVAIIGATFAYFTATQTAGQNNITGNAATISFGLTVAKVTTVDDVKGGLIPMTDAMVEAAVSSANGACVDDNGNAVCQIYEVTVTNTGTAGIYLDGFVNLTGGLKAADNTAEPGKTTMRYVQVFKTQDLTYSVTGNHTFAPSVTKTIATFTTTGRSTTVTTLPTSRVLSGAAAGYEYGGNTYEYITTNYLRMSKDAAAANGYNFTRANDPECTLIVNQYLEPEGEDGYEVKIYFVVWLTETGTNQTPDTTDEGLGFFNGKVVFNSAQGGEVTGTFNGYTRVAPNTVA